MKPIKKMLRRGSLLMSRHELHSNPLAFSVEPAEIPVFPFTFGDDDKQPGIPVRLPSFVGSVSVPLRHKHPS